MSNQGSHPVLGANNQPLVNHTRQVHVPKPDTEKDDDRIPHSTAKRKDQELE